MSDETERLIEALREQIKIAESQAKMATMQASDSAYELKEYHKKYQELEAAAKVAVTKAGVKVHADEYTVQAYVLAALERMSAAVRNDTVDTRMKKLEQLCYQAESTSGVLCREANPWDRVAWVLNQMACTITSLRNSPQVNGALKARIFRLQRSVGAEVTPSAPKLAPDASDFDTLLYVLDLIEMKVAESRRVHDLFLKLKEVL